MVDTRLLVGLVLSLLISSLAISFVTSQTPAALGTPYMTKSVNTSFGIDTPDTDYYTVDFIHGYWTLTENGLVSDGSLDNVVYFITDTKNIAVYDNSYHIVNNDCRPYFIIIRDTNFFMDSIYCEVTVTGIRVKSGTLVYTPYEVNIPGYFVSGLTEYVIRTVYSPSDRTLSIYINDDLIETVGNLPEDSVLSYGKTYYAGIDVVGKGFVIKQYSSTAQTIQPQDADLSFTAFMGSLASVLLWYTSSGFWLADLLINLIIKIQQFAITAVLLTLIRGA